MQDISAIRQDYQLKTMNEADVAADPFTQFDTWWNEAAHSQLPEVNAMTLATATKEGLPDARIVLLKGFDQNGFTFFTNYESAKARELLENPNACLVFFWKELERQVRVIGTVEKASAEASNTYFASRPEGSRIGAWASPQSTVIENREIIEKRVADFQQQFNNTTIERPSYWGGYIVKPVSIEFWQGRSSRLHDRLRYRLENGGWKLERLAP